VVGLRQFPISLALTGIVIAIFRPLIKIIADFLRGKVFITDEIFLKQYLKFYRHTPTKHMSVGRIFSREAESGFFQVVVKSIFLRVGNSGEIAFYQLKTRERHFYTKKK